MKKYKVFISNFLMNLGIIITISPIFLYWFIHGDYERYIWIINGPFPFNGFGGGPFQVLMYISLFITAAILITLSLYFNRNS